MNSFKFYNPTKIYFGENAIANLSCELNNYGENVLLCYGGKSVKANGIYAKVIDVLGKAKKNVYEVSCITPNPRTEKVYEGIKICKSVGVSLILAVGGGSVIDCAKFIAAGAATEKDFWQTFLIDGEECRGALPLGTVLTLAATGSEMNCGGVITNWDKNIKTSYEHPYMQPRFSILDPTYTYTMPKSQLIYGCVDIFSHIFEQYFSEPTESNVTDDLAEALIKNLRENLAVALTDERDYRARANIMWDSTLGLNGILKLGKGQDWQTHEIEHVLSAHYDVPHGAGLAVVHPNFMEYTYKSGLPQYVKFAKNIWGVSAEGKTDDEVAIEGIRTLRKYLDSIGAPKTLADIGIDGGKIEQMASEVYKTGGGFMPLKGSDIANILKMCL